MLEFSQVRGNVALVKASGQITGDDIDRIVADTESLLSEYEEIGLIADMTGLESMTAEAIAKDFASQFKFLGDWKRFPKAAVIAEPGWFEGLARTMGAILPQIEVRTFAPEEREQALEFASGVKADRIKG
ncbi:STAS/SEC14 domain-containing protein [Pelagibacterium sp. 26DY04]|uniref:STAS/SEC14 domain-containing protein n=1 Tax=Pelagibacterium sp. 26DY04 TaxID=2967130 RepID=UPI0028157225|nr:STAS/SEC14 domain-containing protein [Pelagibacterium sp. 26DY04]WMT88596.1 STAS/SEC14 domain-containing protein [Pelagibacterium sp. 26DY04]